MEERGDTNTPKSWHHMFFFSLFGIVEGHEFEFSAVRMKLRLGA